MKLSKKSKELMLFFTKNSHINKVAQTKRTDSIIMDLYNDIYSIFLKNQETPIYLPDPIEDQKKI